MTDGAVHSRKTYGGTEFYCEHCQHGIGCSFALEPKQAIIVPGPYPHLCPYCKQQTRWAVGFGCDEDGNLFDARGKGKSGTWAPEAGT